MISLEDVRKAQERISPYIIRTPLLRVPALDDYLSCKVYIKPENLQHTGSFKLRGATNKLLALSGDEKQYGVVSASSGNHAQGVAYSAKRLGIDAKIVMPENCNPVKLENVKGFGADVVLYGQLSSERDKKAKEIVEKEKRTEVHPYADDYVKAGQGTIALEILEDEPDMDIIVVPIGGGGLISGISIAAKGINQDICIVGVEPEGANRYSESLRVGEPVTLKNVNTIADGTRTDRANPDNFEIIKKYVDNIVTAGEDDIRKAMKLLVEKAKIVAEPSSSLGIGAASRNSLNVRSDDKVCFVISGGNNDLKLLSEILSN
ncbi:MAG: threonine/serine dehydratase [Tissierellaceae bacterium]|nr:threonine/serine dehydratase [Tissierellaceae bacterium]